VELISTSVGTESQESKSETEYIMKDNLPYIAISLYIAITLLLLLIPKKWIYATAKKDFGATEADFKRKDNIGYYRILFLMGGLITVVIMLLLKYVIL
jgi:hypothetical protein